MKEVTCVLNFLVMKSNDTANTFSYKKRDSSYSSNKISKKKGVTGPSNNSFIIANLVLKLWIDRVSKVNSKLNK